MLLLGMAVILINLFEPSNGRERHQTTGDDKRRYSHTHVHTYTHTISDFRISWQGWFNPLQLEIKKACYIECWALFLLQELKPSYPKYPSI